ncbi:MAG: hypothetical protein KF730_02065 [Sphingomonas sp.]|uniref:hypothetical protein n=1 Tax=Sphingomonas sp. TaxID=28214 RepID=UPI0025D09EDD|nr:hypothetical protein [Sphingomonas sp.]MBX3563339.1 hypothetical protein [Sphingomonas sp.]
MSPYLITHNRDLLFKGDQVEQDYNFIDYWFGEPARPIHARHYLRDERVTVDLPTPEGVSMSLDQLRAAFPPEILCYLQKRFDQIEVRTDDGYVELWSSRK